MSLHLVPGRPAPSGIVYSSTCLMTPPTRNQLIGCFVLLALILCLLVVRYLRLLQCTR